MITLLHDRSHDAGRNLAGHVRANHIQGLATLAGTLTVVDLGGYSPPPGNSFTLLTFGSLSGTFDTVNLPALGFGLGHRTYNSGSFVAWTIYF